MTVAVQLIMTLHERLLRCSDNQGQSGHREANPFQESDNNNPFTIGLVIEAATVVLLGRQPPVGLRNQFLDRRRHLAALVAGRQKPSPNIS